ncbi:MAG: hypothetical protein Q8Q02_15015 [Nocardioides sp.]|nr:hypothetical protein [Nocardioides sp.]
MTAHTTPRLPDHLGREVVEFALRAPSVHRLRVELLVTRAALPVEADGLAVAVTEDDSTASWLHTGRFLCRFWTRAMARGLSLVPLSQVIAVDVLTRGVSHHNPSRGSM